LTILAQPAAPPPALTRPLYPPACTTSHITDHTRDTRKDLTLTTDNCARTLCPPVTRPRRLCISVPVPGLSLVGWRWHAGTRANAGREAARETGDYGDGRRGERGGQKGNSKEGGDGTQETRRGDFHFRFSLFTVDGGLCGCVLLLLLLCGVCGVWLCCVCLCVVCTVRGGGCGCG